MITEPRIVIVGGGFAGAQCARTLRKRRPAAEIVLFNRESHMVFHPLLAEVAGASINPDAVAASLRQVLPEVILRTEEAVGVELQDRELVYQAFDGHLRTLSYDHLVLACGETINLASVPGMAAHAMPLKTIGDALAIRARVMDQLERANVCEDPDRKRWHLTFVVIGGGFSGVEVAGEINDLARGACRYYRQIDPAEIHVQIVHSRDQLLPEIVPRLRAFAQSEMEAAGIEVILSARASYVTAMGVYLSDERRLPAGTVVCTVGTTAVPLIEHLQTEKHRGRIVTRPDMRLLAADGAWAIGDCAWTPNAHDGTMSPPTGQFAVRQGRQVAENIARVIRGEPTRPFAHRPLGELCAIGGRSAVGELFGRRVSGLLAWCIWRTVYLFKLPTRLRVKVGFDWAWEIFFARDLAHLKIAPSSRVSIANYDAGDDIFRVGDPATDFYIIRAGEVEVRGEESLDALAVLRAGDFFGEMALLDDRAHQHTVRARTRVELLVTPRDVFTRLSGSLAPLREMLTSTMRRRTAALWPHMPLVIDVLRGEELARFVEPLPTPPLLPDDTFDTAIQRLDGAGPDIGCVVDDADRLVGVVTRTDLLKAVVVGTRRTARVEDFMTPSPVAVELDGSPLAAVALLREHHLKWLPVIDGGDGRRLRGCVRAQTILLHVLQHGGDDGDPSPPGASA